MNDDAPPTDAELAAAQACIESWLERTLAENPVVQAVERDDTTGERRWFVRVTGEQKPVFSVWFHLRQRSLHVETYVMPAPMERHGEFFEHLLRRNSRFHGLAFAVGAEDAVYLIGQIPVDRIHEAELDRLLGSTYAYVEQCFRPAMRLGFGARFTG